jgi:hypothetical protein
VPILAACAAGLYGMRAFSESEVVNSISYISEESDHRGKLLINIASSPFTSRNIIVNVRDIHSVV